MKKPAAGLGPKPKGQASIMGFFKKPAGTDTPSKRPGEDSDSSPPASAQEGPVEGKKAGKKRVVRSVEEDEDLMEVEADLDGDALPTSPLPTKPAAKPKHSEEGKEGREGEERRSKKGEDKGDKERPKPDAGKEVVSTRKRLRRVVAEEEEEEEEEEELEEPEKEAQPQSKKSKGKGEDKPSSKDAAGVQEEKDKGSEGEPMEVSEEAKADDDDDDEEEEEEGSGDDEEEEEEKKEARPVASVLSMKGYTGKTKAKAKGKGKTPTAAATTKEVIAKIRALPDTYKSLPYKVLSDVFDAIEKISGRLEITDIMRELFSKSLHSCPQDLTTILYLACNRIAPAYEGLELGIGETLLFKAIETATGRALKDIKAAYQDEGDLGTIAQSSKATQRTLGFGSAPKPLDIQEVLEGYREIARFTGNKSQDKKVQHITKMLRRVCKDGHEAKYLIRGLQAKLRIGLAEKTVLVALAHAVALHPPPPLPEGTTEEEEEEETDESLAGCIKALGARDTDTRLEAASSLVKQAYCECPDYAKLSKVLTCVPLSHILRHSRLTPGIPVSPMLAKPEKTIKSILKRLSGLPFTMEFKYDGERAQVHKLESGEVKIFSRNSEDMTSKYPDLIQALPAAIKSDVTSFVMDAEVVAWDPKEKKLLSFQTLSTRKRKDEKAEDVKVMVILQAFDLIFLNGKPLLREPLRKRRELLHASFAEVEGKFAFAVAQDHKEDGDTLPIETFLADAVAGNCEGLMIKTLDDTYEPIKRSLNWLKLKKDYVQETERAHGVADALDLVVIGAYHGKGKRTGWYGAFLLACYDPDLEEYQSVCKVGTGFSEERLAKFATDLKELIIPRKPNYYKVGDTLDCDEWFDAKVVWEVKAADLSKSPVHMGAFGKVEAGKGIALRFPRFIRERDDKKPENATNAEQVVEMYKSQELADATKADDDDDDEDGYL